MATRITLRVLFWTLAIDCLLFVHNAQAAVQREELETDKPEVRILYNIGHMANDIAQADQFIKDGANGLEVDLRFESNGIPSNVFHGFPCDCFRDCMRSEKFDRFLAHMRVRSTPGNEKYTDKLSVLILDMKLGDVDNHDDPLYAAGDTVAALLSEHLFQNGTSRLWVIVGVPNTSHAPAFRGFRDYFKRQNQTQYLDRIGYEVFDEPNMDLIQQMFRGINIVKGIWQGDGITNCVVFRPDARLRQAISKRDAPSGEWVNVDKVYRWTIDTTTAMRHSLRLGVDGIMTNDPDDVLTVIAESEFAPRYRLATNIDNPLEKIVGHGPLRVGCSRNYCWKDCSYSGRWCWTAVSGCSSNALKCTVDLACSGSCGR